MKLHRCLAAVLAIFVSGCFFASVEPLFGPDDFESLTFNGTVFESDDARLEIQQFGQSSRTYGLVIVDGDDSSDVTLYRAGFVALAPDLYVVQAAQYSVDGPFETLVFSSGGPIPAEDYGPDSNRLPDSDDAPFAYVFVETERAPMPTWASQSPQHGITAIRLYTTLEASISDSVAAIGEKHGISLTDGYMLPEDAGNDPEKLKAFFRDVFTAHKDSFTEPNFFRLPVAD